MPPAFAPVYRPRPHNQTFLHRQQKLVSGKRKRGSDTDDDDAQPSHSSASPPPARSPHPVSRTDPYHVAGLPRESFPPPFPFPHAAVKERPAPKQPIEEALAQLNPPLYVPSPSTEDNNVSLKRRHLDNLTFLLHRSLHRRDWTRARRIWAILLRIDVDGSGIDIRRHERWGIGAEVLMRRDSSAAHADVEGDEAAQFSDDGFAMARQYYERLCLQYPHTANAKNSVNATVFYPALFNIWVYEVQDRSKRAREQLESDNGQSSPMDDHDSSSPQRESRIRQIRTRELAEALPIAKKMDDLLLSPPYDTHMTLLHLRAMVALWISDLHNDMIILTAEADTSMTSSSTTSPPAKATSTHHANALASRQKAEDILDRLKDTAPDLLNPIDISNAKLASRQFSSNYPDENYS